ncbi:MAG: YbaN family protein [Pseudomonadota bacterium]
MRYVWLGIGWGCVGLATIGVWIPGLPTVPFLLVAVWAFSRGSPAAKAWLLDHVHFGPLLRDWFERGAIPRAAKRASAIGMGASYAIMVATVGWPAWVLALVGVGFVSIGAYVWSRPEPTAQP